MTDPDEGSMNPSPVDRSSGKKPKGGAMTRRKGNRRGWRAVAGKMKSEKKFSPAVLTPLKAALFFFSPKRR
jgi:hypothetical protein